MKKAVLIALIIALFTGALPALADKDVGATVDQEVSCESFEPEVAEADEGLLPIPPEDDSMPEIDLPGEAGPAFSEVIDQAPDQAVSAHDMPDALRSGFYYYEIEDGCAVITDVEEEPVYDEEGNIVDWDKLQYVNVAIPATIDGCPVTRIGERVFRDARSLQSVTFPDCLREIGREAFADCECLASAPLPEGLTLLDCNAFAGCVCLKSINIPLSLKTHEFVTEHAYPGPFSDSGLIEARFADGMTHIEPGLFQNCGALQSLNLPASVTQIGHGAFLDSGLRSIGLPDGLKEIHWGAFKGCESLYDVTLPAGLTFLDCNAFADCASLKSINIPKGVVCHEFVTEYAYPGPFANCENLRTVTFADGATTVPKGLFFRCNGIRKVTLANTIKKIECGAFMDCENLAEAVLPASLTRIEEYAFEGCEKLKTVALPARLAYLGLGAFRNCKALQRINIPAKVKMHEDIAANSYYPGPFAGCSALRTVTFAKGITAIPNGLFYQCDGIRRITIPGTVTTIGDSAFCRCSALARVTLGKKVKTIRGYAFAYCEKLAAPKLPASLRRIEDYAFTECSLFKVVKLPARLTYLGLGVFKDCKALKEVNIPAKVTTHEFCAANSYYPGPFAGCSALRTVTFGKGIRTIPQGLFYQCDGIRKLTLPDTVTTIEGSAFCRCSSMTEIHIGKKVRTIGGDAFLYCDKLKHVYFDAGKDEWKQVDVDGGNDALSAAKRHLNKYIYILCLGGCEGTDNDVKKIYSVLSKISLPGYTVKRAGKKALTMSSYDMSKALYEDKRDSLDMKKYLTKEFYDYYIKETFRGAAKDDLCIFYLHSHGMGGGPSGKAGRGLAVLNKKGEAIAYTYEDFLETLTQNVKGQIVFLPDVCYSGGFVDTARTYPISGKDHLSIISSSSIDQESNDAFAGSSDYITKIMLLMEDNTEIGNYTASLADALSRPGLKADTSKKKDGVSIQELFSYIKETINKHGAKNYGQIVQCFSRNKDMIIFR